MSEYFVIDQDTQQPGGPSIANLPESIEISRWLEGSRIANVPELIELELASSSGSLRPDLVTYLIPLFSERIRATLDAAGVDNIDYYPVTLTGPEANQTDDRYMLGNVLGLVECIAHSKSNGTQHPLSKRWQYTSFVIDEERVSTLLLFRPLEMRNLIVVHEHLAERLSAAGLDGVRIRNTRDYDGY